MTAEIAILNRTAVALAADSVVTLGSVRGRKTYDSAEKIFQLSRRQPIGLMIYNNAQFMNAPLEVLARSYRDTLSTTGFTRLDDVWPDFSTYLLSFSHTDEDEGDHFRRMAFAEIDKFRQIHFNYMVEAIGRRRGPRESAEARIGRAIVERRAEADGKLMSKFLADKTQADFSAKYGSIIDQVADVALAGLNLELGVRTQLHELMFSLVRSNIRTNLYTGFVFAGFGRADIFPTLHWVEADGVYFDQFRIVDGDTTDIDRRGVTAAVVPFAQTDMAERFMFGIDRKLESDLSRVMARIVEGIVASRPRAFPKDRRAKILEEAAASFADGLTQLKDASRQVLDAVVDHLSKKELGEVAYSLVELTSRKRRYSTEPETVGGPIDVAILTRSEGFIWVRRKHYFDAALNPQYATFRGEALPPSPPRVAPQPEGGPNGANTLG